MPSELKKTAWERWISGDPVYPGEVAAHVLASWERCRGFGLDPCGVPRDVILAPEELARRRDRQRALLTVARRFISELCVALPDCRFVMSVADAEGYKLESVTNGELNHPLLPGFQRGGLGENWSEAVRGTNAIGTALAMNAPVFLRSDEHFFKIMRSWNCSGVPIRDAAGRLVAVLNLAGPAEDVSRVTHGLTIAAAREIERELELDAAACRLEEHNRRLAIMNEFEQLLSASMGQESLRAAFHCLCKLAPQRMVALLRPDHLLRQYVTEAAYPSDPTRVPARWPAHETAPINRCARRKRTVLLSGDQVPAECVLGGSRPGTILVVPVRFGHPLPWILLVADPGAGGLDNDDTLLYEAVARRIGAHAERCLLHREVQAEAGLRRAILQQMDAGIVVMDLVRGRLFWNRPMAPYFALRRLSARLPGGDLPRPDRAMKYPIQLKGRDLTDIVADVLASGVPTIDEAVILCDPPRTFRVTTGLVRSPEGTVQCILQTYTDVTSYRRLEQQKAELVAMISHELRTPLTGIKGYAQLLRDHASVANESFRRLTAGLLRETDELAALVERVVAVNRVELEQSLALQPVNLKAALKRVIGHLAAEADLREVTLSLKGPDLTVEGDRGALELVFSNLIDNAIKYSPAGAEIVVRLGRDGQNARVEVSDRGPGIPAEHHEAIFQRFYRVRAPETVSVPGSGLGLYIVRRLVERMNGRVKVTSQVGKGTTFAVVLPMEVVRREQAQDSDRG